MNYENDTIAAIATAPGEAGIAVVRISGNKSLSIADKFLASNKKPSQCKRPALLHGHFRFEDEEIDEVLVLVMPKPKSYTKEDIVEIQCHGGYLVSQRILRCLLAAGARMANPGEFTARAFLNGRLDLVQAEAVADLIHAQTERATKSAVEQLKGDLSQKLDLVYANIMDIISDLESGLDFSEEEAPPVPSVYIRNRMTVIQKEIEELISTHDEGTLLREGARVVISGKPNVGKSTLLNKLLDSERAIVSEIPGTTRDTIEERIVLDGFPIILTDTAGLRDTECQIEAEGIRRTMYQIDRANLHIYIIDASIGVTAEDKTFLEKQDPARSILVRNKVDLGTNKTSEIVKLDCIDAILVDKQGLTEIKDMLKAKLEMHLNVRDEPHSTISERHYKALTIVRCELKEADRLVREIVDGYEVLAVEHLRTAAETIGEILGKNYHQDLLDSVFSKFCIGK